MSNMGGMFVWMRKMLKAMDEKQLLEMFHDMDDIAAIERIADAAYHFVENYEDPEWAKFKKDNLPSITELNQMTQKELDKLPKPLVKSGESYKFSTVNNPNNFNVMSEDEENKEADDLQRYRDIKSTNERPF